MTANRWWVKVAARWIARIDSVQGHLSLVFQAMTGVSVASGALKFFNLTFLVPWFLAATAVGLLAYAYLYSEGGVWNQVKRDKNDLSTNFSGPTMLMDDVCIGTGQFVAEHERKPTKDERQMIYESVREQWEEFRDGVPIEEDGQYG